MAMPAFGTEGTGGCAPATKVRGDQERGAPAGNIAPEASGSTGEVPGGVQRVQGGVATSAPKVWQPWTRGCRRRVKRAPYDAETRVAACKGVSAVRRHAGGLYDAGTYCYTLVKCLKQFVRNGKGVIEANDYTQGSPINSEPLVIKRTHCNEKRVPKAIAVPSAFGLPSVPLFSFLCYLLSASSFLVQVAVAPFAVVRRERVQRGLLYRRPPFGPDFHQQFGAHLVEEFKTTWLGHVRQAPKPQRLRRRSLHSHRSPPTHLLRPASLRRGPAPGRAPRR
jgi:hypothetical protein